MPALMAAASELVARKVAFYLFDRLTPCVSKPHQRLSFFHLELDAVVATLVIDLAGVLRFPALAFQIQSDDRENALIGLARFPAVA